MELICHHYHIIGVDFSIVFYNTKGISNIEALGFLNVKISSMNMVGFFKIKSYASIII